MVYIQELLLNIKVVGSGLYKKIDKGLYLKGFLDLNILPYSQIIRELIRVLKP